MDRVKQVIRTDRVPVEVRHHQLLAGVEAHHHSNTNSSSSHLLSEVATATDRHLEAVVVVDEVARSHCDGLHCSPYLTSSFRLSPPTHLIACTGIVAFVPSKH